MGVRSERMVAGTSTALLLVLAVVLVPGPAGAATITASPNPVLASSGLGSTTVLWDAGDAIGQVRVSVDGGPEQLVAEGSHGSQPVSWIQRGHAYAFRLYAGAGPAPLLASTVVAAGAMLYTSPGPVAFPGSLGATAITWDTGGVGIGEVRVSPGGGPEISFAAGARGTQGAPWIQPGVPYLFRLYAGATLLAQVEVRAGAALSAAPNPVLTEGAAGTAMLSWSTGTGQVGQVWVSVDGASEILFAQAAAGTAAAPWIRPGSQFRFVLYDGTARAVPLSAVTVTGGARVGLRLAPVLTALSQPLFLTHAGDGTGRLYVVEKAGRIRQVTDGYVTVFADLRARVGSAAAEQGLLGLAFHPGYASNRQLFVSYTDTDGDTVIARYTAAPDGSAALADSEEVMLRVAQPAANHNGGWLGFGPDGALYVALGDGGGAGDTFGNAQNGKALLGKLLRIDVDGPRPYTIPADNPFVGVGGMRAEIWALGLRNPWRPSFDRLDGRLFIADVGQNAFEEIDVEPPESRGGNNYGWPRLEGAQCFPDAAAACDRTGMVPPVLDYPHAGGIPRECSITGGYVYRGPAIPLLRGAYLFGDFCSGRIWSLARQADGRHARTQVLQMPLANTLSSFGEDEAGELYAISLGEGTVYQVLPAP